MVASGLISGILATSLVMSLFLLGGFPPGIIPDGHPNVPFYTIDTIVPTSFADFVPYDEDITPNAPEYSVSPGLSNVVNLASYPALGTSVITLIEQNGFAAVPQFQFKQIHEILEDNNDSLFPSFVSSDAVLHAFHVLYDLALREVEVYSFWDLIGNLTVSMLESSYEQYLGAPEGRWSDAALRNVAYFSVTLKLLDDDATIPSEVIELVDEVISLIDAHAGISNEWFMGYDEDFSQYVPRGHYTRSELLERYFKALMWYGRIVFRLIPDGILSPNPKGFDETAQAILVTLALQDEIDTLPPGVTGYEVWEAVYQPTVFFVGDADDLLPTEYLNLIADIYGTEVVLTALDNDQLLSEFIEAAVLLRDPTILSTSLAAGEGLNKTKGLRFMGQRFIPDSYILGQLVFEHVGGRMMPKGLDVMAALGSDRAWELLDDQKHYPNYVEQMEMLWDMVENITVAEWTKNLYYLWLYSLLPLLSDPGEGYPLFMQSEAWVDKQLMTALGSWAELRHDTILYAKQSYTYETSVPPSPGQGYVEPVPHVYGRLASLCSMMIDGLDERSLLSEVIALRLATLLHFLESLREISIKELTGQSLNETEVGLIENSGMILSEIVTMPNDEQITSDADDSMAVIADVHTDANSGTVLEEAVGYPMLIYVAVLINGEVVLTRGGTFSYYEFAQPMSDRLTDEAWQAILEEGSEPAMPEWTSSFVASLGNGALAIEVADSSRFDLH
ncbi:MAG: DUF3160 domain-containing protein [Candidatus Thorarchaeota archaeon]|nr:MAG: DUF3160 domain-containing protein [Candidatus Thorarchaeota archaeon]